MGAHDQEYSDLVNEMLESINKLPQDQKLALKSAYVFSRKVPKEEREDVMQDLMLNLLKYQAHDEKLIYSIARCDWKDWWKSYKTRSHYQVLDSFEESITDTDQDRGVRLADLLTNEIRFEYLVDGKIDGQYLWDKLPATIKPVIAKRLQSKALTGNERVKLHRYIQSNGSSLLAQS
jgi:hypothetical protein